MAKTRRTRTQKTVLTTVLAAAMGLSLSACGTLGIGGGGDKLEAPKRSAKKAAPAPANGVNAYLWRATLETLNFLPLDQVDPYGGVIITDWYADPNAPSERLKANVYILDTNLRADALKVAIFKQVNQNGSWQDAPVDADTARQVENSILTRARQLYIATVDAQ